MTARTYAGIGARDTPGAILDVMQQFAQDARALTLRSGGAIGADSAFERGARMTEIWLPWHGYNARHSLHIVTAAAVAEAARFHPAWKRCTPAVQKMHGRNMHIILGVDLQTPVEFVVCWTKGGDVVGGTGQAIRCALHYSIPVYNLAFDSHLAAARSAILPPPSVPPEFQDDCRCAN